jgi:hypothetical protein
MCCFIGFKCFSRQFELSRLFVYRKVSEMHIVVFHILAAWFRIIMCAKASKSFVAKISIQRFQPSYKQIKPYVEFLVVY